MRKELSLLLSCVLLFGALAGACSSPPAPPQSVTARAGDGDGTVTVEWSHVSNADTYNLYWSTDTGVSVTTGTKIEGVSTPYVHRDLADDTTYYYVLTAVGAGGESDESAAASDTTRPPRISGTPVLPPLEVDAGDVTEVILYDLAWNEIANDTDSNPAYNFDVERGRNYILATLYGSGQSFAALTPTVTADLELDITLDTEVAMNLIVATERAFEDLLPGSLSRPLDDLLTDANQVVMNLNAFYDDRNTNRQADRVADAVHALTVYRLNYSSGVPSEMLNEDIIRAFGGGLQGIRSLEQMASDPLPPLNPHFVFTRYNQANQVDFGMSDLDIKRWDFMGNRGMSPHIATGGDTVAFSGVTSTEIRSLNRYVLGLYIRELGTGTSESRLITPWNMDCYTPSWSPDQSKIAFSGRYIDSPSSNALPDDPYNIFIIDVKTRQIRQLTFDTELGYDYTLDGNLWPSWSPDGKTIIFTHSLQASSGIPAEEYLETVKVDDPVSRSTVLEGRGSAGIWQLGSARYSPDGSFVVFSAAVEDDVPPWDYEIIVVPSDYGTSGGSMAFMTYNEFDDTGPDWSYDGRFIIFSSDRGGEPGRLPGQEDLQPFYVVSAVNGEMVAELGDFANAGFYHGARFCGTEAVMVAVQGTTTNNAGDVMVAGSDRRRSATTSSDYNYYREIIPAANAIGVNFNVSSWW